MPSVLDAGLSQGCCNFLQQICTLVRNSPFLKYSQFRRGLLIKVSIRYQWISIRFSSEVTSNVSAVLEQQGIRFIFWMTLEEDKEASFLLDECINAYIRRTREYTVSTVH